MTSFLVTGATGFVGGALVRLLIDRGHRIRALVRPTTISAGRADWLRALGVEIAPGDLTEPDSLDSAVLGVEGLFHVAAEYRYWSRRPADVYRTNVEGTKSLFAAARAAGVRRAVFTSTVATLKWPGHGKLADESSIATENDLPGHYKKSKLAGELAALEFNNAEFEVVVVNPTAPFGPGDARPTPTGRIVLEFLNNRLPGYVDSGVNVCDVDDVAAGHLAAFDSGRPGDRYILGSENVSLGGIYQKLTQCTGLRRTPVRVPFLLAYVAGFFDFVIEAKILQREPHIPIEGLRVARHPMYVDCSKAVNELGLPQRPAAESLDRAARWYAESGYSSATGLRPAQIVNPEASG